MELGVGYADTKPTDFVATLLSLRSLTFSCHAVTNVAQRKTDKGAASQVSHERGGWGGREIACESGPEKRNLSRISFALGLSVCAYPKLLLTPRMPALPLPTRPCLSTCRDFLSCFQTCVSCDMRGQLPQINHEQLSPSIALI